MEKVNESSFAGAKQGPETETSHLGQLTNLQPVSHNVTMRYDELQHKRGGSSDPGEPEKLTELKGPFNSPPNRRDKWPQGIATESATVSGTATTSPSIHGSITQQLQVLRQKMKQPKPEVEPIMDNEDFRELFGKGKPQPEGRTDPQKQESKPVDQNHLIGRSLD